MTKAPSTLKYTKDHEWVSIEDGIATVGITDFAQQELGDIVYVEVDTIGEEVSQEDEFGTIEAVKTVSDLFAPVSGDVVDFNEDLEDDPESLNGDPYGQWIVKIQMTDESEIDSLLSAKEYSELTGSEVE